MAALAAGAVIGGSLLSGMFGRKSQKTSIGFQREMAQKAHQYEVADLRKAGLNPILSGTGGGGARASGGAMPSTPDFAGSAVAALRIKSEIKNIQAQTNLTDAKTSILGTGAEAGQDIKGLYQYIKERFPNSAKKLKQLIDDYAGVKGDKNPPFPKGFKPHTSGTHYETKSHSGNKKGPLIIHVRPKKR